MTWTAFSNLTNPTLPELDANLLYLYGYSVIPCTIAGTNALTLTVPTNAPTLGAYGNTVVFAGALTGSNTGAVTVNAGGLGALPVYLDTLLGPQALIGGELVSGNYCAFAYDGALDSGNGGFHAWNGAPLAVFQSVARSLTATGSTIADAYQTTAQTSVFSSVGSGTGALLMDQLGVASPAAGATQVIFNRDSANALLVYPAVAGGQIDALGAGAGYSLAHAKAQVFTQVTGGSAAQWYSFQVG